MLNTPLTPRFGLKAVYSLSGFKSLLHLVCWVYEHITKQTWIWVEETGTTLSYIKMWWGFLVIQFAGLNFHARLLDLLDHICAKLNCRSKRSPLIYNLEHWPGADDFHIHPLTVINLPSTFEVCSSKRFSSYHIGRLIDQHVQSNISAIPLCGCIISMSSDTIKHNKSATYEQQTTSL